MLTPAQRKKFKESFCRQRNLFGAWTSLAHPQITEMFCSIMKPDFLGIDIEHGTINQEQSQRIIAAGQASGVPVLPRIASHNGEQIKRLLDSGADGVIVPMVNSKEEVERIVEWFFYPPRGRRSYGISRAQGYGDHFEEYTQSWNKEGVLVIQVESIQSVENLDSLLSNDCVDGVMIGPYDISGSLGIPGKLEDPKVLKACDRVVAACQKYKKACGTQITEPTEENVKAVFQKGFTFAVLASDIFLMWKWSAKMRGLIEHVRESF